MKPLRWFTILGSIIVPAFILLVLGTYLYRAPWRELAGLLPSSTVWQAIFVSLKSSVACLLLLCVLGTCLCLEERKWPKWFHTGVQLLTVLPVFLPPAVAGLALLLALGKSSLIGAWLFRHHIQLPFSLPAVVLAQLFVSAPFFLQQVRAGVAAVDSNLMDMAATDGVPHELFDFKVMMPLLQISILDGLLLAGARAIGEFGATILFAGNLQSVTQTMPLAIYVGFEEDLKSAQALGLVLIAVALVVLAGQRYLRRRLQR